MSKKTVIVACASSMITSTVASNKIREIAKENGLPEPRILQLKFSEVKSALETNDVDFIVPTGKLQENVTKGIKVISGTPFVTGVNEEKTSSLILEALQEN